MTNHDDEIDHKDYERFIKEYPCNGYHNKGYPWI